MTFTQGINKERMEENMSKLKEYPTAIVKDATDPLMWLGAGELCYLVDLSKEGCEALSQRLGDLISEDLTKAKVYAKEFLVIEDLHLAILDRATKILAKRGVAVYVRGGKHDSYPVFDSAVDRATETRLDLDIDLSYTSEARRAYLEEMLLDFWDRQMGKDTLLSLLSRLGVGNNSDIVAEGHPVR